MVKCEPKGTHQYCFWNKIITLTPHSLTLCSLISHPRPITSRYTFSIAMSFGLSDPNTKVSFSWELSLHLNSSSLFSQGDAKQNFSYPFCSLPFLDAEAHLNYSPLISNSYSAPYILTSYVRPVTTAAAWVRIPRAPGLVFMEMHGPHGQ